MLKYESSTCTRSRVSVVGDLGISVHSGNGKGSTSLLKYNNLHLQGHSTHPSPGPFRQPLNQLIQPVYLINESTIPDKIFETKWRNLVKLNR